MSVPGSILLDPRQHWKVGLVKGPITTSFGLLWEWCQSPPIGWGCSSNSAPWTSWSSKLLHFAKITLKPFTAWGRKWTLFEMQIITAPPGAATCRQGEQRNEKASSKALFKAHISKSQSFHRCFLIITVMVLVLMEWVRN